MATKREEGKMSTEKKEQPTCAKCGAPVNPADEMIDAVEIDDGVFAWVHLEDCTGEEAEAEANMDSLGER